MYYLTLSLVYGVQKFHACLNGYYGYYDNCNCVVLVDLLRMLYTYQPQTINRLFSDRTRAFSHWLQHSHNAGHYYRQVTTMYNIVFRPIQGYANAESLSQLFLPCSKQDSKLPDPRLFNIQQIETLPVTSAQVKTATNRNTILSKVLLYQTWVAN